MRSSYSEEDVILLLKDITGLVEPQPAKVREKLIQSGKHYSEMLPVEYVPTDQYMQVYHNALKHYAKPVANAVGMLADKIIENLTKHYRATLKKDNGFLLLHSTGTKPTNTEVDVPIVYADYYFIEALMRKNKLEKTGKLF